MHTDSTTPVRWDTELGTYLVSGFDEASAMLRGSGWSSDPRLNPLTPLELRELPPRGVVFLDPPDHTRLRNLLSPPFTPRATERLRPRVAAIADAVLDAVTEDDPGSITDVVQEISQLVPLAVISELLDVETEGAELFQAHTPALFRLLEVNPTAEDLTESVAASIELMLFLTPLLAERRQNPGDDFISTLLAIEDMTLEEVLSTCMILLTAGHETTAAIISNSTLAVLSQPDRRAQFLETPAKAIEELLRLEGPVKLVGRTALILTTNWEVCRSLPDSRSSCRSRRPTGTRGGSLTQNGWTSPGNRPRIWRSAAARTSASARRWPGWKRPRRSPGSSPGSPS